MKRCARCGKKKFFLYKDLDICFECHEAIEKTAREELERKQKQDAEQAERLAKSTYVKILNLFSKSTPDIQQSSLSDLRAAISAASDLESLIPQFSENQQLVDLFQSDCTYLEFSRTMLHSVLGSFMLSPENTVDLTHLIMEANKRKEKFLNILSCSERFANLLSGIPNFPISFSHENQSATRSEKYIPELKTTSITARTPITKINSFVAVDLETTGLSPINAEIIQIAAIRFVNFSPIQSFSSYVKPRNGLSARAQEINHITLADVENAPYIEDILPSFDQFIGDSTPVVGHNLSFDFGFLVQNGSKEMWRHGVGLRKSRCYDTLDLARHTYSAQKYKLDSLCREILNIIRDDNHDARSDALVAGLLFCDICERRTGIQLSNLDT